MWIDLFRCQSSDPESNLSVVNSHRREYEGDIGDLVKHSKPSELYKIIAVYCTVLSVKMYLSCVH